MSGNTVCLFRNTDTSAPVLSGTAGALIGVLDACLINGYNSHTLTSITRSGSTATATFTAHGYALDGGTKIQISGADQTEYNGIFQISNVTANTFDFTVTGTPATPATGTITSKVAPSGWTKSFSGTNKAAYKSSEGTSTGLYLRVDDTNAQYGLCRGYETMSDVDTGTGLFPTTGQTVNGVYCSKSSTSDGTARSWVLASDGFEFYLFIASSATYYYEFTCFHFGDPVSDMASDPYGCLIYGQTANLGNVEPFNSSTSHLINAANTWTAQSGHYYARLYNQVGQSPGACKFGNLSSSTSIGLGAIPYPAPHNNGLYISPIFVGDGSSLIRAQLKGIYNPLHNRPLGPNYLLSAANSPIGHRLWSVSTSSSSGILGETHIDIDGPWR